MSGNPIVSGIQFLLKGGPVMWPLFLCAILAVAVMIERFIAINKAGVNNDHLMEQVSQLLNQNKVPEALRLAEQSSGPVAGIVAEGLRNRNMDSDQIERTMEELALRETPVLYKRLGILDTVITIAPLLGLLGTVTGMIRSFHVVGSAAGPERRDRHLGRRRRSADCDGDGPCHRHRDIGRLQLPDRKGQGSDRRDGNPRHAGHEHAGEQARRGEVRPSEIAAAELKRARIEIIPMIDTIFFLLVFFMITSLSMVQMQAHRVSLPQSETADGKPVRRSSSPSPRTATIMSTASRYRSTRSYPASRQAQGQPEHHRRPQRRQRPERRRVREIMDIAKQANPTVVMIATAPKARGK